jgi:ABC-2 type transport system permease protein
VASSALANLTEPMVVLRLPVMIALAAALSGGPARFPAALAGILVSFAFTLAAAQAVGLLLQGLSRNRRAQDWALFLGVGLGFLLSLLPLFFLTGRLGPLARAVLERDPFAISPFAWGVRAAVHGGRGEHLPFLALLGGGGTAVVAALALSAALARRIYRGELVLGGAARAAAARSRGRMLPGALGALLEKDLRITWRDPRLKATIFTGLLGPLLVLFVLWPRGVGGASASALLLLASFTGIATFGSNAFALERRGLLLLLGFPVERWKVLVAKNAVAILLRLPGLALLAAATLLLGAPALLVPVLTAAVVTLLIASGADNFLSILFPIPVPAPGANPYGPVSGGRGLGAAAFAAVLLGGALLLSSPFVFLVWLPPLLETPWLWALSLPLALAGAGGAYAILVSVAGSLLEKREPSLIARVLAEE